MRRLIFRTRQALNGWLHRQHIADLEQTLSELITARNHIDTDIQRIVTELIAIKQPVSAPPSVVDRVFPDVSPRSY